MRDPKWVEIENNVEEEQSFADCIEQINHEITKLPQASQQAFVHIFEKIGNQMNRMDLRITEQGREI